MNEAQNGASPSTNIPVKRPTLRQDLESRVKLAVDAAARAQKALMTLPPAILDQDPEVLAESGIYINTGYPF